MDSWVATWWETCRIMKAFPPQADDPLARALPLAKVRADVSLNTKSFTQKCRFKAILRMGFPVHKPYAYSLHNTVGFCILYLHFRYLTCLVIWVVCACCFCRRWNATQLRWIISQSITRILSWTNQYRWNVMRPCSIVQILTLLPFSVQHGWPATWTVFDDVYQSVTLLAQ